MHLRIASINFCNYGSTGNIMVNIMKCARDIKGYDTISLYPKSKANNSSHFDNSFAFGDRYSRMISFAVDTLTGNDGGLNIKNTRQLIRVLKAFSPDIIHLHNLHNNYLNLKMLFTFIKKSGVKVVWTLHDCWSFTGRCPHFLISGCESWKTGCCDCRYPKNEYPKSFINRARYMWKKKKELFNGVRNLTIVTPSKWLSKLVAQSFLRDYPVEVIYNGVDATVFCPVKSSFREDIGIGSNDIVLLGVASPWTNKKGLDVFVKLADLLPEQYKIVLVGTNSKIDSLIPSRIISIHKTTDKNELAKIYAMADLFVNPSREENFPTTNIEALLCGTPVLTFDTGGSSEAINENTGKVIPRDDIDRLFKEIVQTDWRGAFTQEECRNRGLQFEKNKRFCEYIDLYERVGCINGQ